MVPGGLIEALAVGILVVEDFVTAVLRGLSEELEILQQSVIQKAPPPENMECSRQKLSTYVLVFIRSFGFFASCLARVSYFESQVVAVTEMKLK